MLISKTGKAQICDYGLSSVIMDPEFTTEARPGEPGPLRWYAPEIIASIEKPKPYPTPPPASESADVFAFAMLAVEVFTGNVPFENMKKKAVTIQILNGKRPPKPPDAEQLGLTEEMWKSIEKCWCDNPKKRPAIDEVVRAWNGFVNVHQARLVGSPAPTPFADQPGKPSSSCGPQTHGLTLS